MELGRGTADSLHERFCPSIELDHEDVGHGTQRFRTHALNICAEIGGSVSKRFLADGFGPLGTGHQRTSAISTVHAAKPPCWDQYNKRACDSCVLPVYVLRLQLLCFGLHASIRVGLFS